jgi:hypothetical protein
MKTHKPAPERTVWFSCQKHTDQSRMGWWLRNDTPIKCDQCESRAEWILVQNTAPVLNKP